MDIPSVDVQRITAKIATLRKQRDDLAIQANKEIAYLSGQIAALEALLRPEEPAGEAKSE